MGLVSNVGFRISLRGRKPEVELPATAKTVICYNFLHSERTCNSYNNLMSILPSSNRGPDMTKRACSTSNFMATCFSCSCLGLSLENSLIMLTCIDYEVDHEDERSCTQDIIVVQIQLGVVYTVHSYRYISYYFYDLSSLQVTL